jgi:hypothetical protein
MTKKSGKKWVLKDINPDTGKKYWELVSVETAMKLKKISAKPDMADWSEADIDYFKRYGLTPEQRRNAAKEYDSYTISPSKGSER